MYNMSDVSEHVLKQGTKNGKNPKTRKKHKNPQKTKQILNKQSTPVSATASTPKNANTNKPQQESTLTAPKC